MVIAILFIALAFVFGRNELFLVSASSGTTVKYLPGFEGPLPFYLETGYVGVGESEDVQLFYYFVKSERNPEKDALLFWLSGGPGCTSWSGFAYEVGPLRYRFEPYNGTLPTMVYHKYSWTTVSSIIFIDAPAGVGFSYSKTLSSFKSGDVLQARHLVEFFKKWLIDHPEFISNPIYIAGDSYSGIPVPIFTQGVSNGIEEGSIPPIKLEGYLLGNPYTDPLLDLNHRIQYAHGMALISDELYADLKTSCQGRYYENVDPTNTECLKNMQAFEKSISGIQLENILRSQCPDPDKDKVDGVRRRRSLNQDYSDRVFNPIRSDSELPPEFDCPENELLISRYWANDPEVQKALHVRKGKVNEWIRCVRDLPYDNDVLSSVPYHANLSTKGYRSLIFSGDHDMAVPFISTQQWIRSLNYSIVDDWRPWLVHGQVAGYTRTYSNGMTFTTVKGGSHTSPDEKPEECIAMFQRWIDREPI